MMRCSRGVGEAFEMAWKMAFISFILIILARLDGDIGKKLMVNLTKTYDVVKTNISSTLLCLFVVL